MTWLRELRNKAAAFTAKLEEEQRACSAVTFVRTQKHQCDLDRGHGGPHYDRETMKHWAATKEIDIQPITEWAQPAKGKGACRQAVAPFDGATERCARMIGHDGPHKTRCSRIGSEGSVQRCNLIEDHEGFCATSRREASKTCLLPMKAGSSPTRCGLPYEHAGPCSPA